MSVVKQPIHTLGVLGLGEGRSILSAAATSSRWRIGGICDLNEELGRARQREFAVARFTTSYAEIFSEELDGGPRGQPGLPEGIGTVAVLRAMELSLERALPVTIAEVLNAHQLESIYE